MGISKAAEGYRRRLCGKTQSKYIEQNARLPVESINPRLKDDFVIAISNDYRHCAASRTLCDYDAQNTIESGYVEFDVAWHGHRSSATYAEGN
jgi:hypothetical protein